MIVIIPFTVYLLTIVTCIYPSIDHVMNLLYQYDNKALDDNNTLCYRCCLTNNGNFSQIKNSDWIWINLQYQSTMHGSILYFVVASYSGVHYCGCSYDKLSKSQIPNIT
jgi:hypothetical protein